MDIMFWDYPNAEKQISFQHVSREDVEAFRIQFAYPPHKTFDQSRVFIDRGTYVAVYAVYICGDDVSYELREKLLPMFLKVIEWFDHELQPIEILQKGSKKHV